jgi:uncharacterized protein (TIGR01244 family)
MQFRISLRRAVVLCAFLVSASGFSAAGELPGIPNFQKVNDQVYRGGQPEPEGFANLAALGIKTVVDLRWTGEHSQADEQRIVESTGMRYVSVPMKGMATPDASSVAAVLALLENSAGPVFVHCQRGADRTGAVIACYRIQHDGWGAKSALEEAGSFGMSWYQRALRNYVVHFEPSQTDAANTRLSSLSESLRSPELTNQ